MALRSDITIVFPGAGIVGFSLRDGIIEQSLAEIQEKVRVQ